MFHRVRFCVCLNFASGGLLTYFWCFCESSPVQSTSVLWLVTLASSPGPSQILKIWEGPGDKAIVTPDLRAPNLKLFSAPPHPLVNECLCMWQAHTCYIDLSGIHVSTLCVSALPLMKVLRYSALNAVMWSKYAMKSCSISAWDCHICH